jgi:hypothetical protein
MKLIKQSVEKLALCLQLLLMLFLSGCVSSSGGSDNPVGSGGGYRTLKQVDHEVTPKMTRFRNALAAGTAVTQDNQQEVNNAYARYQAAYTQALHAAGNNPNAPAPDDVTARATQLLGALNSIP